ncbi:putative MFS family arabinose efflux permease [Herbihabitans rhizosphaerae]|uniref:Putative MFS family arabinose efflux permease n=1 Tax=Herbihabitans rhizosphaerae TaxID=1872711 RepID=A0A4Q7KFD4_9PSEU|nr:MFS transporter [Herbihabitans rhizosphaerae]RZS32670.1 putative MFS family arabinose efflux permease [Herbihabitans rhizosphaerae]
MTAPLAVTEFRALWMAEAQSVAGDQLAKVALAILVYERTRSALAAAAVYALTFLPALAGGLGLSHLADKYPRKRVMVVCTGLQAVLVGLMAIPGTHLLIMCALLITVQVVQSPFFAAQNATTRQVFTDDEMYLRSQDLRGMTTNTMMLLGLAVGGLLVTAIGAHWALAINSATFAITTFIVQRWVVDRPAAGGAATRMFDGARWAFGRRDVRVLLTLSWLVGLAVVPEGLAAPLASEMNAPAAATGWLLAADPLGYVIGTFVLSRYLTADTRKRIVGILAVTALALLTVFALKPSLPVALLLLMLSGAVGAYQITVIAMFNTWVPDEVRGGAIGIARTGLRVAQGVGVALGGAVAEGIGPAMTIALAGGVGILIAVPAAVAWHRLSNENLSLATNG